MSTGGGETNLYQKTRMWLLKGVQLDTYSVSIAVSLSRCATNNWYVIFTINSRRSWVISP